MRPRGLPPDREPLHVVAICPGFRLQEPDRGFDVVLLRRPDRLLGPGVVHRGNGDPGLVETGAAVVILDLRLVAPEPGTAVDIEDEGWVFGTVGKEEVEHVPFPGAIGEAFMGGLGGGARGQEGEEKPDCVRSVHCTSPW